MDVDTEAHSERNHSGNSAKKNAIFGPDFERTRSNQLHLGRLSSSFMNKLINNRLERCLAVTLMQQKELRCIVKEKGEEIFFFRIFVSDTKAAQKRR